MPISSLLSFHSLILSSTIVYLTFNLPLRIFNWNYYIFLCRSSIWLLWLILYHSVSWLFIVSISLLKALLISNNYFVVSIKPVYHLKFSTLKACWVRDLPTLTKIKFFSHIFCNFGLWVHLWWNFMCENSRLPRFSMCLSPEEFYFLQAGDLPSQFYDIFLACQFPDHRSIRNLNPMSTLQNRDFHHLFPNLLFLLILCQSTTVTKKVTEYHS